MVHNRCKNETNFINIIFFFVEISFSFSYKKLANSYLVLTIKRIRQNKKLDIMNGERKKKKRYKPKLPYTKSQKD